MSRETTGVGAKIRALLKGLIAPVAVTVAVSLALSAVIRNAASTTPVAPALATEPALETDRALAVSERVSNERGTSAIEGNSDPVAIRGSSDPYSNMLDPFEAYSGDFSRGEPIPAAMLRTIEHAKGLL